MQNTNVHLISIVGSTFLFLTGAVTTVNYENETSQYYCYKVPFKTAFGVLILLWILFPFVCLYQISNDSDAEDADQDLKAVITVLDDRRQQRQRHRRRVLERV